MIALLRFVLLLLPDVESYDVSIVLLSNNTRVTLLNQIFFKYRSCF